MATRKNQNAAEQQQPADQKSSGDESQDETSSPSSGEQNPLDNEPQPEEQGEATTTRKVVTFLRPFSRYTRGDVAGFEPDEADRLVKKKVAVEGDKLPAPSDKPDDEPKA